MISEAGRQTRTSADINQEAYDPGLPGEKLVNGEDLGLGRRGPNRHKNLNIYANEILRSRKICLGNQRDRLFIT